MKNYDRLMSQLPFREDFCEDTLKKAVELKYPKPTQFRRPVAIAACVCLCAILLLGTALAVSPALRAILIPNSVAEATEDPKLPTDPNGQQESTIEGITARYYKLDGVSAAHEGFGSVYPVMKDGKVSFYSLTEDGKLEKANSPRHIQRDIIYKGHRWSLDMELYNGDIPVIRESILNYPIHNNCITLGRWENNIYMPIYVDLDTFAIEDPAEDLAFAPDEDARKTYIYGTPKSSALLICSELSEDLMRYYYGNRETGQVTLLGEGIHGQWSLHGDNIYYDSGETISQVLENGIRLPLFGGKPCSYDSGGFAYRFEGSDLHVIDLRSQGEYLLTNCADTFSTPIFSHNGAGTKFCISNAELTDGLYNTAIAIVDRESGTMVTLKRNPAMTEEIIGWFDHDHFLIGGTIDGEWYISLYEIS